MPHAKKTVPVLRPSYFGYGLQWTSRLSCFQSTALFSLASNSLALINLFFVTSLATTVVFHFAFAYIAFRNPKLFQQREFVLGAIALLSAGLCVIGLHDYLPPQSYALLVGGAILHGMGGAWLDMAWLDFYGRLTPAESQASILASFAASLALWFVVVSLSGLPLLVLFANLLLVGCNGITLCRCLGGPQGPDRQSHSASPLKMRQIVGTLGRPLVGAAAFAIAYAFFDRITSSNDIFFNEVHRIAISCCLVAVLIMLAITWFSRVHLEVTSATKVIFPILVIGCLLFPAINGPQGMWSTVLVAAGFMTYDILMVALVAEVARETTLSGAFIEGITRGTIWAFAGIGGIAGYYLAQVDTGIAAFVIIALALLYLIVFGFSIAFTRFHSPAIDFLEEAGEAGLSLPIEEDDNAQEHRPSFVPVEEDAVETDSRSSANPAKMIRFVNKYGLTRREEEVALFLVHGRTLPYIAEEMVLSEHTVRTHVRHIYEKTDVHSRQDFIDLFEST